MSEAVEVKEGYHFSVVIPVYNEEALLETAITDLVAHLEEMPLVWEVIIAENGSTDRTLEIAKGLAQKYRNVRYLHVGEPNYGKALKEGILQSRGIYVVCDEIDIIDVDFYKEALRLLMEENWDMVIGSKLHEGAQDKRPWIRHLATKVINLLLRILLGFKGTDTHGLKAFKKDALLPVVKACVVDKDLFASEMVIRAERAGLKIKEIPVTIIEKRKPQIHLFKRVPNVLKNLWRLFWAIRFDRAK